MTKYLIANARINENGSITGGKPGDQTGLELATERYYTYDWEAVYRPVDTEKAEQIADFMEKACLNGFVGYDQEDRHALFRAIADNDFKVEELNEHVSCDCSSLVYCALYSTYRIKWRDDDASIAPVTKNYPTYIETMLTEHFTKFVEETYLTTADNLQRGDILYKNGHVGVWI